MWQAVIGNLAVAALVLVGWVQLGRHLQVLPKAQQTIAFSVFMGAGAVISMVLALPLQDGIIFDLRASLIAISGFFGGPLAAIVSAVIASAYRISIGGAGLPAGLIVIATAALFGAVGNILARRYRDDVWRILILSLAATLAVLAGLVAISDPFENNALTSFGLPVLGFSFAATFVFGLFILQRRRLSNERRLLQAALLQSPDFQYTKDRQSRFLAVNQHVADCNGFVDPADMRGKTDFDIAPADRAKELFEQEQHVMATGQSLIENEECLVDAAGNERWYSTSKSAVIGSDGTIIGLTGVTREITERKRIEAELLSSRNLLSFALTGMSDGLAMFDANNVLIFCNEQYRAMFPLTAGRRVPGTPFRDIARAIVETGEQIGIPREDADSWINSAVASLRSFGEHEAHLADGRWVRFRTRPMDDGVSIVTVADVTQARLSQDALLSLTAQLRSLAGTDGLTGLANRRAFDQALLDEFGRCMGTSKSLSLLMIDVDRFKSYNDLYGHLAGDDCLRSLAQCLQLVSKRPREIAARYGGEEFALILPGCTLEEARIIAERVRALLADRALPHAGNTPPFLTASIGVASLTAHDPVTSTSELVHRADEALYEAKNTGRNRVVTWGPVSVGKTISAA
jgi:diguanylate cyclase (GGDEF)-like protein/PAS domain S-box-containing protein